MGRSADLPMFNQFWRHVRQNCIFREQTLAFAEENEYLPVRTGTRASGLPAAPRWNPQDSRGLVAPALLRIGATAIQEIRVVRREFPR